MVTTSDGTKQPGTPTYQVPEILLERRSGHVYSDMWSVGCTVLELFLELPAWSVPVDTDPDCWLHERQKKTSQILCKTLQQNSVRKVEWLR